MCIEFFGVLIFVCFEVVMNDELIFYWGLSYVLITLFGLDSLEYLKYSIIFDYDG